MTIEPVHRLPSSWAQGIRPAETATPGEPAFRFFDRADKELLRVKRGRATQGGDGFYPIEVEHDLRFAGVAYEVDGKDVATLRASAHPPKVNLVSPVPGQRSRSCRIEWDASDLDGDRLQVEVEVRRSGMSWGRPMYPMGTAIQGCPLDSDGSLRVSVSDGFRSSSVEVEPLQMPTFVPPVMIERPAIAMFEYLNDPRFRAFEFSIGGFGEAELYLWTSSRDGYLGEGRTAFVSIDGVSEGPHEITLEAVYENGTVWIEKRHVDVVRYDVKRFGGLNGPRPQNYDLDLLLEGGRFKPMAPGDEQMQALWIRNRGKQRRNGPVEIELPVGVDRDNAALQFLSASGPGWRCQPGHHETRCTYAGSIEAGAKSKGLQVKFKTRFPRRSGLQREPSSWVLNPWARDPSSFRKATRKAPTRPKLPALEVAPSNSHPEVGDQD